MNFGQNCDSSNFDKYPFLVRKCISMGQRVGDLLNHARIFPIDSLRFFPSMLVNGVRYILSKLEASEVLRREGTGKGTKYRVIKLRDDIEM